MTRRTLALALFSLILPATAFAAPSPAVKKARGLAGQLAGVKEFVAPEDPRMEALVAAIATVGQQDDSEAAKTLLSLLAFQFSSASVEVNVAEAATDALTSMESKPAHDVVRKVLSRGKKNPDQAAALAEIVGGWFEEESAKTLAELVDSKNPAVVMSGARGLGNCKHKAGVKPLIDIFDLWQKRAGEPINVIGQALYDITGQALTNGADWKNWWKTAEKGWDASKRYEGGDTGTSERPKHFQPKGDPPPELFSDLTVSSTKFVIIMDVSGSMHIRQFVEEDIQAAQEGPAGRDDKGVSLAHDPNRPRLKEDPNKDGYKPKKCTFSQCPGARGTGPECPSDEKLPKYFSRMKRLSRHMAKLVGSLRSNCEFQMVAFSTDARTWKGTKLINATAKNKAKAQKWLLGLQAGGFTRASKAIELAFSVVGADTFIFVTDGGPTNPAGRPYPPERWRELLDDVKRMNRKRKVRIDVVAISEGHTDFSSGLADESGGGYVVVD